MVEQLEEAEDESSFKVVLGQTCFPAKNYQDLAICQKKTGLSGA